MKYCEWCSDITDKLSEVKSLGTGATYKICDACKEKFENEECIKCGEIIVGKDIAGKCLDCAVEQSEMEQIQENDVAEGIDPDSLKRYRDAVNVTEDDIERWLVLSVTEYTPEEKRKHRFNWLKSKLLFRGTWTSELIDENLDDLTAIIDKYSYGLVKNKYDIIYYPEDTSGKNSKYTIDIKNLEVVDRKTNILVVEK